MKHSFQIITISIIAILTIVLCWQIYWLMGLYQSIRQETYATLTSAVEMADFNELAHRIKYLNKIDKEKKKQHKTRKEKRLSFNYDFDIYSQSPFKLMRLVDGGIHKMLDPLEPINFNAFCTFFKRECKNKGIDIDLYEVVFYHKETGKAIHYNPPGMKVKDAGFIKYHNADGSYFYEVDVTPLTKIYLYRMWGIILTTFLVIVLLSIAFWYLIRTIISQRSIEEMKDDFTNNMTHELKTPIAVSYSAVDALLNFKQGEDKEKRERYLKICEEQLKKLSGLVEKILSMSMEKRKALAMNMEEIALLPIIQNLEEEYELKSNKKVLFCLDIVPMNMTIHADLMHINNAISNIIDNSIKYSGKEVTIKIKTYHQDSYDVIEMTDNGIGISQEHQKRIFDKFYRVPHGNVHNVSGYGLGLYYVRQIIERHKGTITVDSNVNRETKVTITLPASS
jgi:nitrogen-specific signal transduction histidine kinase